MDVEGSLRSATLVSSGISGRDTSLLIDVFKTAERRMRDVSLSPVSCFLMTKT